MLAIRRYANTQNETASKERMMVLLFEAALRHMRRAAAALESGRSADAVRPGPAHKAVLAHMAQQRGQVAAAIACRILELRADRAERGRVIGEPREKIEMCDGRA